MVSKYDVFYIVATRGEIKVSGIVEALNKPKEDYQNIFNNVLELEKTEFVKRGKTIKVIHDEKPTKLFSLISFCTRNSINYNLMFKDKMLEFIQKAAKKEFFTINDIKIHPETFNFYTKTLAKYGFLLVASRKPLKCKLLRHHFLIDLLNFFNKKLKFYSPKKNVFIAEIKKELKKYQRNMKINYRIMDDLEKEEEAGFIYSSLNFEGNPLTLPETQQLIQKDIVPENQKITSIQEVINYKRAVDSMVANAKKKKKLNLHLILEYHEIAMSHIGDAGKIRKQNVVILLNPKFKTCDWRSIDSKLDKLMEKYRLFESKRKKEVQEMISFASFFHNEFQRIHPFIDGNSRISRLLMLHILRSNGIPILDLPQGYFDLYLDLTKRSVKRNDEEFSHLISEIVFANLKRANGEISIN